MTTLITAAKETKDYMEYKLEILRFYGDSH